MKDLYEMTIDELKSEIDIYESIINDAKTELAQASKNNQLRETAKCKDTIDTYIEYRAECRNELIYRQLTLLTERS